MNRRKRDRRKPVLNITSVHSNTFFIYCHYLLSEMCCENCKLVCAISVPFFQDTYYTCLLY
jgi:hypothetical protein